MHTVPDLTAEWMGALKALLWAGMMAALRVGSEVVKKDNYLAEKNEIFIISGVSFDHTYVR
jgi:hypothetical protein